MKATTHDFKWEKVAGEAREICRHCGVIKSETNEKERRCFGSMNREDTDGRRAQS